LFNVIIWTAALLVQARMQLVGLPAHTNRGHAPLLHRQTPGIRAQMGPSRLLQKHTIVGALCNKL